MRGESNLYQHHGSCRLMLSASSADGVTWPLGRHCGALRDLYEQPDKARPLC